MQERNYFESANATRVSIFRGRRGIASESPVGCFRALRRSGQRPGWAWSRCKGAATAEAPEFGFGGFGRCGVAAGAVFVVGRSLQRILAPGYHENVDVAGLPAKVAAEPADRFPIDVRGRHAAGGCSARVLHGPVNLGAGDRPRT